jgi:energy-coupling factor transporter ATP-binding protein EcfA2
VSEPTVSQVIGPQAPVSSGSGTQNIYFGPWPTDRKRGSPRSQAADDLRKLAQRFVPPVGFGNARRTLQDQRTVFIYGPPGSGRTTAARLLLGELAPSDGTIHQLLLQDRDRGGPLDFDQIRDSDHVWLDLTDTGGWSWNEIRHEFPELRLTVRQRAARLVAILPDEDKRFDQEVHDQWVAMDRPPLHEVLQRHLRMAGFPAAEGLRELHFTQQNGPLRDVPRYVGLIAEAKDRATSGNDFLKWCAIAYEALNVREAEVRDLIAKRTHGSQRALLLTVAMLHGAHADVIEHAVTSLLKKVGHPPDDSSILEHAGLDQRLDEIEAELDHAGNIRFKVLGFDSAVRSYFWTHIIDLRKPLRDWLETVLGTPGIDQDDRENLIRNFAGLCLKDRYIAILIDLVDEYTRQHTAPNRVIAAALILQCGLREENYGRTFRRQIYDWSTSDNIPDEREAVIVAACQQEIASTHPDEALVRLHHVARRKHRGDAHQALIELVRTDRRFLRQLLARIVDRDLGLRKWDADRLIFLDIADPAFLGDSGESDHPPIAEQVIFRQLCTGWNLVFTDLERESWTLRACEWLRHAAADEKHRDAFLEILIRGGEQCPNVLARLYATVRQADVLSPISNVVLEKIMVVQDVEFT